jgi:diguanylate cyclase (GGDEF)-like protein
MSARNHTRFALALLDIDDFKHVNDVYGHLEGDRALLTLVNRISQTVRSGDMVCRFGGDEFIILFKHMDHDAAPRMAASRVFNTIGTLPMTIGLETVQIKTSMGVAVYGIDGTDPDTLLKKADALLYRAKEQGKNKLVFSR